MKNKIFFFVNVILSLFFQAQVSLAVVVADKEAMDKARLAYEKSDLTTALNLYNKISSNSDFWVESLEEKAWAQLRQKNSNEATSLARTLLSEVLAPLVGPEPYFLQTLIEYRLCDYRAIFGTIKLFKARYAERTKEIEKLANAGTNKSLDKALQILTAKTTNLSTLKSENFGYQVQFLPRFFYRDQKILNAVKSNNLAAAKAQIQFLAKQDLNEITDILRKLQLVETQVVQQVYAYEKDLTKKRKGSFNNKGYNSDEMYFPYDGEIWLDEINQFQTATEKCPVDPFDNPMPGKKTASTQLGEK